MKPLDVTQIRDFNNVYRKFQKKMTNLTKVEIEPDPLTIVLDYLSEKFLNIAFCVCPGAGGYDAITLVT